MLNAQIAASSRPTLGFTLEGLSGREETLFKAIVRLLDHRTLQRWVYRPARPDVRVVGDGSGDIGREANVAARDEEIGASKPLLLTISMVPGERPHCLGLPLRADELEAELNSLGILRVRTAGPGHPDPEGLAVAVRLLRWPPADLVGTPERVKLATLMLSRPVTLGWLQQRSGFAPAACAQFFAELHDAGVLARCPAAPAVTAPEPARTTAASAPAQNLLARIRNRLGLLMGSSLS